MQQINLFHAQFKPKKVVFPASQMVLLALLLMAILAMMSGYSFQQNKTLEQAISVKKQPSIENDSNFSLSNPLLTAELDKLKLQLLEKEKLLGYLSNHSFGNQRGFSEILSTLSLQVVDKVWLTEFSLDNGGELMTLRGQTSQVSQIPMYIDSLAKATLFQGKKFSVFQLSHPSEELGVYSFELNTEADSE